MPGVPSVPSVQCIGAPVHIRRILLPALTTRSPTVAHDTSIPAPASFCPTFSYPRTFLPGLATRPLTTCSWCTSVPVNTCASLSLAWPSSPDCLLLVRRPLPRPSLTTPSSAPPRLPLPHHLLSPSAAARAASRRRKAQAPPARSRRHPRCSWRRACPPSATCRACSTTWCRTSPSSRTWSPRSVGRRRLTPVFARAK